MPSGFDALRLALYAPPDAGFDVSPRRRMSGAVGPNAVPPTSQAQLSVNLPLQDTLTFNDGLLLEHMGALITPSDQTGKLTITDQTVSIATGGGGPAGTIIPFATPVETTLSPRFVTSLQLAAPPLLTQTDLDQMARQVLGAAPLQPYSLILNVGFANADAAGHLVSLRFYVLYRLVRGLMGA